MAIEPITDTAAVDAAIASGETLWLFKHSNTCGISMAADEQVRAYSAQHPDDRILQVIIQTHRPVSNYIAEAVGRVHQSPQIFLVKAGAVEWAATHYSITASAMAEARTQASA